MRILGHITCYNLNYYKKSAWYIWVDFRPEQFSRISKNNPSYKTMSIITLHHHVLNNKKNKPKMLILMDLIDSSLGEAEVLVNG